MPVTVHGSNLDHTLSSPRQVSPVGGGSAIGRSARGALNANVSIVVYSVGNVRTLVEGNDLVPKRHPRDRHFVHVFYLIVHCIGTALIGIAIVRTKCRGSNSHGMKGRVVNGMGRLGNLESALPTLVDDENECSAHGGSANGNIHGD